MKGYWLRIGLGALGVFVIGMIVVAAGRRGVTKVRDVIETQTVRLTSNNAPFRVDGRQLGMLSSVSLLPSEHSEFPRIELAVQLDSAVVSGELAHCVLVVPDLQDEGASSEGLRCLDLATVESQDMLEIGAVHLESTGEVLQIFAPRSLVEQKNWFRWFQNTPPIPPPSPNRASFQLQADSGRAFMMIRDEHGNPVFQMNADSEGAFIQVRDSNGQEVVRFRADAKGVVGNIQAP